jgi:hypothetical protein
MRIDESLEHFANAEGSMHERLEPDSNVTDERDQHSEKQDSQSFSTEEGMQIDESDEHFEKTIRSMPESLEPDSNVTDERDSHS